jgi:hypothetical protein
VSQTVTVIRLNSLGWWFRSALVAAVILIVGLILREWTIAALAVIPLLISTAVSVRLVQVAQNGSGDGLWLRLPGSGRLTRWLYRDTFDSDQQ